MKNLNRQNRAKEAIADGEVRELNRIFTLAEPSVGVWYMESFRLYLCLGAGTLVLLADDTEVPIESLKGGEEVLNIEGTPVTVVGTIRGPEKEALVHLSFSNGRDLCATADHPFVVVEPDATRWFARADELSVGMALVGKEGGLYTVRDRCRGPKNEEVITVLLANSELAREIPELGAVKCRKGEIRYAELLRKIDPFLGLSSLEHSFFAEGVAVGDGVIQNGLKNGVGRLMSLHEMHAATDVPAIIRSEALLASVVPGSSRPVSVSPGSGPAVPSRV